MAKILIVDDDLSMCDFLKGVFVDEGFEVDIAVNGQEALEKVESSGAQVILLDINLPDISGIEILRQIKEKKEGIKVVMLTGIDSADMARLASQYGASDYITKPFDLEVLTGKVIPKILKELV